MAQVPEPVAPRVDPSSAPTPTLSRQTSPFMFGGGLAEGLQGVGQELEQTGGMLASHAVAFQQINNKTMADQAQSNFLINQLAPTAADFYTKKGQDAIDAYKPTLDNLEAQRQAASEALPNQQTRLLFDEQTRSILSYEARTMSYHVAGQRDVWQAQTMEGQIAAATNLAVLHNNDPRMRASAESAIQDAIAHNSALHGAPKEFVDMQIAQATSKLYSDITTQKVQQNSRDAQAFFRSNYSKFDAADADRIGNMLKSATASDDALDTVMGIVHGSGTASVDKLVPAISSVESADGKFLLSGKGAEGIMQLMPDTARQVAKEMGVPFDPQRLLKDNAYNTALGTQYLKDLNQQFHGNQALITAAYNAGPGVVQDWLDGTNKSGKNSQQIHLPDPSKGQTTDQGFADQIPFAETKDYVSKVASKTGGFPQGNPPTNLDIEKMYPVWQKQLADAIGSGPHTGDEMYAFSAEKKLESYVASVQKGQIEQQRGAFQTLDAAVIGNRSLGQPPAESIDQVLAAPGAKAQWALLKPEQQKVLMNHIQENISGPKTATPVALEKYHQLLGEFRNDPVAFNKEDIAGMGDLPTSMRRELIDRQASPEKHVDEHIGEAMSVLSGQLQAAGITKADNIDSYNKFTGAMTDKIDEFAAVHNRHPNDSDIMKMGQQLLQRDNPNGIFKGGYGFEHPSKTLYSTNGRDIPDTIAQQIVEAHRARFGTDPNEGQIAYWYQQYLRGQNGR